MEVDRFMIDVFDLFMIDLSYTKHISTNRLTMIEVVRIQIDIFDLFTIDLFSIKHRSRNQLTFIEFDRLVGYLGSIKRRLTFDDSIGHR